MLLAAFLTLTLNFTYPTQSQVGCGMFIEPPLDDLASVEVHFHPRYARSDSIIYTEDAHGREGTRGVLTVTIDSEGTLWVTTVDNAGNRSCASNYVGVAFTTDVPLDWKGNPRTEWFDVAGRKYRNEPQAPGVYLVRRGPLVQRIVKLR